jgi:hypothetical protein
MFKTSCAVHIRCKWLIQVLWCTIVFKADCHPPSQETAHLSWNLKSHYRVHKSRPLGSILSRLNPVHVLILSPEIHFKTGDAEKRELLFCNVSARNINFLCKCTMPPVKSFAPLAQFDNSRLTEAEYQFTSLKFDCVRLSLVLLSYIRLGWVKLREINVWNWLI